MKTDRVLQALLVGASILGARAVASAQPCTPFWSDRFASRGISGSYVADLEVFDDGSGNGGGLYAAGVFQTAGGIATPACEAAKLTASDAGGFELFGCAVALSTLGTTLVIGACTDDGACPDDIITCNSGSVYVLVRRGSAWVEQAKLTASDAAAGDAFGSGVGVSADGHTISVGANGNDEAVDNVGAVYVFVRDGSAWVEQAKLTGSDAGFADNMGLRLAISADGDTILAGSSLHFGLARSSGAVYVFARSGLEWMEEAELVPADGQRQDFFGSSVALSEDGTIALIGADNEGHMGPFQFDGPGAAYLFVRVESGWIEQAKLTAPDPSLKARFGRSVALSADGGVALIGAVFDGSTDLVLPNGPGAAYVFEQRGKSWTFQQKLIASDAAPSDFLGYSATISAAGDVVLIGAVNEGSTAPDAYDGPGAAYAFVRDGASWSEHAKLVAADGALDDGLGIAVAISSDGGTGFVGALSHDLPFDSAGATYVFDLDGLDCNGNGVCDPRDIADGTSEDSDGNGIPDECECPWDLDGNGSIDHPDLVTLIDQWGTNPGGPPDFDGDGVVAVPDLLTLLAAWGPCP